MTQRYFMIIVLSMPAGLGAGLYLYAYSLAGPLGRAVLTVGATRLAPRLRDEVTALFWIGRHAAARQRGVSAVFEGLPGAEGATEAGLQVPAQVSAYQAAADEDARILAGFDTIVRDLEKTPAWLDAFHENTAANPVYRAWVLERTGELDRVALAKLLAEGRELAHA